MEIQCRNHLGNELGNAVMHNTVFAIKGKPARTPNKQLEANEMEKSQSSGCPQMKLKLTLGIRNPP